MNVRIQSGQPPILTTGSAVGNSKYNNVLQRLEVGQWVVIPKTHKARWATAIAKYMKRGQVGVRMHATNPNKMIVLRKAD